MSFPSEHNLSTLLRVLPCSFKQGHTPTVPIPPFDKMLDPLLVIATKEPLIRPMAAEAVSPYFSLTEEERNTRIPTDRTRSSETGRDEGCSS